MSALLCTIGYIFTLKYGKLALDSPLFRAELRVDPLSRCAALSLPKHALAILPFYQTQAELEVMDQDQVPQDQTQLK